MGKHSQCIWFCISLSMSAPVSGQETVLPVLYANPGSIDKQDFNGLPNTGSFSFTGKGPFTISAPPLNAPGLAGWQIWMRSGTNANTGFAVSTGSSTGSNVYSLGSSGSADRALGTLASGTGIYSFGIILTNNTGSDLNRFTIGYTAEQWRKGGSGNTNTWSFRYKTGIINRIDANETISFAALDMRSVINTTSVATLNGNLPENQKTVSATVYDILWKKGEQLLLRWDDADETGSDDAMAIDNFSFSAEKIVSPPSASLQAANAITASTASISTILNTGFGNTAVWFEYDTTAGFLHADTMYITDSIPAGITDTLVSVNLSNLQTGSTYYYRMAAANISGMITSNPLTFTTSYSIPSLSTKKANNIRSTSAVSGGIIFSTGGSDITEKGIVWSLSGTPFITDNKTVVDTASGDYTIQIKQLPAGKMIYARAYAINVAGTAYGNTISFTTATNIVSLVTASAKLTNAAAIQFQMQTAEPVSGLSASNFSITAENITAASVSAVNSSSTQYTVTVQTGNGDGSLAIQLINDTGLSIPIENKPFTSSDAYIIDKSPPRIRSVSIPDTTMKYGDTVEVTIRVQPDTSAYSLSALKVAGQTAAQFRKMNDSTYTAVIVIKNTSDIPATSDIPVQLTLKDAAGNSNTVFTDPIIQSSDAIDITKPALASVTLPLNGTYKAGDTLDFIFHFSERIFVTGMAENSTVSITVGSRTKAARYVTGNHTDSLHYRYIIAVDESDNDGIRFSTPLTFRNISIADKAGNPLSLSYSFPGSARIIVDAVLPKINSVTVPPPAIYKTGNILDFTVNFSKKIWVDTTSGTPFIQVFLGNAIRNAYYASGEGGSALLFRYKITNDDMDKDGIKLSSSIQLSNAVIYDGAGNHSLLQLNSIGALSGIIINPPIIAISGLVLPPDSLYGVRTQLVFTVQYNENAFVDTTLGIPSLRFTAGSTYKYAIYQSGSGSRELVFAYVIQPGDLDTNGIVLNTALLYNNGNIKDERGNTAPTGIGGMGNTAGIQIDAVQPMIKSVLTPEKNTYGKTDTLDFAVSFSEKIFTGDSMDSVCITLVIGTQKKKAIYQSGIGSSLLLFRYIVQPGDNDPDGIKLDSVISNAEKMLRDKAGNRVLPFLKNIGALSGIKIVTPLPVFVTDSSRFTLCANQNISVQPALQARYDQPGQQLVWQLSKPAHGSLSAVSFVAVSNGGITTPGIITYTPDSNYSGKDSVEILLTDGTSLAKKVIHFLVQSPISDNKIGPSQYICTNNPPAQLKGSIPSGGNDVYTFSWEMAAGNDSLIFSKAGLPNTKQDYQPGKLSASTWFRRKVQSGACENTSAPVLISVSKTGFWTGGFDSLWHNPNNWCMQAIPDETTDVLINGEAKFAPLINETAACHNLSLLTDATLIVRGKLQLYGNTSSLHGKIDVSKGTLSYSSSVPQAISSASFTGNTIENLVINNRTEVSADTFLLVTGKLALHSGTLSTQGKIKLAASAAVAPSAPNTTIKGELIIEHLITGGRSAFRMVGHPFIKPVTPGMIKDSIDITGDGGPVNGFAASTFSLPSAFWFDPLITNDSIGFETGWQAIAHTNASWKENTGMRLLVRGRPGQGLDNIPPGDGTNGTYYPADVRLLFSGPVHTGDHELVLPKNIRPTYHVVSNPYPCPVDLSLVVRGAGMAPHYWIWDPWQGKSGGYSSTRSIDHFILPSFGTFIVKVNDPLGNALQFTENSKVLVSQAPGPDGNFISLGLETGKTLWDKITVFANDHARIYADENDAEKFNNPEVSFYSISRDKKALSTDTRPINNESVIPLGLQTKLKQSFTIRVADMRMPSGNTLQLHDRYLNRWIPLIKDSAYTFLVTDDTLSYGEQRFEISSYRKEMTDTAAVFKLKTNISPIPARDQLNIRFEAPVTGNSFIRLFSQNGTIVKQVNLGMQKNGQVFMDLSEASPGIYLLEIKCGEYSSVQKIIKQ